MNCKVYRFDQCRMVQETYKSPTFDFGIDITNDEFEYKVNRFQYSESEVYPTNFIDETTLYIEDFYLGPGNYEHQLLWTRNGIATVVFQGKLTVVKKGRNCGCNSKKDNNINLVTEEVTVDIKLDERIIERITDKGPQGDSAYQVAVDNGFIGTEEEWLESLHGEKGDAFTYGDFTPEQLEGLKGEKGDKGDKGDTGEQGIQGVQGEKGEKGDAFTYDDFTPEQLELLKGEKGDKGDKGDTGEQGIQGIQGDNGFNGWTTIHEFESDGAQRQVKKLVDYIGGTGDKPTENIGQYVIDNGYTTDKSLATNFKGDQNDNLIFEYVHSGNKEIHIESYDEVTGIFTATNHGMTTNEVFGLVINSGVNEFLADVSFSNYNFGNTPRVIVLTADTFQLGPNISTPTIFVPSSNFDLSKFHLEQIQIQTVINNIDFTSDIRLVMIGNIISNAYFYNTITGFTEYLNIVWGNDANTQKSVVWGQRFLTSNLQSAKIILTCDYHKTADGIVSRTNADGVNASGISNSAKNIKWYSGTSTDMLNMSIGNIVLSNGIIIKVFKI